MITPPASESLHEQEGGCHIYVILSVLPGCLMVGISYLLDINGQ